MGADFRVAQVVDGDHFVSPLPSYQSQFASAELVSEFLDKRTSAMDDPRWEEFGFANREEYEFWAWRACGLLCVKMILDAYDLADDMSVAGLLFRAVELGGFVMRDEAGNPVDRGWYYAPLVRLAEERGLLGVVLSSLSLNDICAQVLMNHHVVASVHPSVIRGDCDSPPDGNSGGHLVLVNGFRWQDGRCVELFIHDPSGRPTNWQGSSVVTRDRFEEASASRGFALWRE